MRARIAVVVQRCDETVIGGSESLAWQYAKLLASEFDVEILTSTARDYMTWDNALPAGKALREGIPVIRFPVTITRQRYWFELHGRLMRQFAETAGQPPELRLRWRAGLEEEFIKFQGPYCPELSAHLQRDHARYAAVVFCTYLYPTTHFSINLLPPSKAIFVPTLHDEPTAYLSAYRERAAEVEHFIWLTKSERRVAERLWGRGGGDVVGMAVDNIEAVAPERMNEPYFLYCGRIEQGKGCHELLEAFSTFRKRYGRKVKLVFTGADNMGLPRRRDVEFLGFVDEARKFALMAGALAFVLPSEYESFSIVALEAMAQRTPVILNGRCEVLRDHIEMSGGGLSYRTQEEFVGRLEQMSQLDHDERTRMGEAGRRYVVENYNEAAVRHRLIGIVKRIIGQQNADASRTTGVARPQQRRRPGR